MKVSTTRLNIASQNANLFTSQTSCEGDKPGAPFSQKRQTCHAEAFSVLMMSWLL